MTKAISIPAEQASARDASLWVAPAALLFAWLTALALIIPMDHDEAVFSVVATGIVDGEWPYRDLFDHKPPLIYAWFLPAGLTGSLVLQRVVAAAACAASVGVFATIARREFEPRRARIALLAYVLLLGNPFLAVGTSIESYMLLPLVAALALPSAFGSGALLGAAVMTKPTAVFFLPLLLYRWRRQSWLALAGCLAACVTVAAAFIPVWAEFWDANITFNREFSAHHLDANGIGGTIVNVATLQPQAVLGAIPLWIAAIAGAFNLRRQHAFAALFAVCAVVAVKSNAYAGGSDYAHYYTLLAPPMALLSALGFDSLVRTPRRVVALGATAIVSMTLFAAGLVLVARDDRPAEDVGAAVAGRSGNLYAISASPQVYAHAGRQPDIRFFFAIPLLVRPQWSEEVRDLLAVCPPDLLVLGDDPPVLRAWGSEIAASYGERTTYGDLTLYSIPPRPCER